MENNQLRCLLGSVVFHGALAGLLVLAPGFSHPPKDDSIIVETLTMIPSKIIDQEISRITAPPRSDAPRQESPAPTPPAPASPPEAPQKSPTPPTPPVPEPTPPKPEVKVQHEIRREEPPPTGKPDGRVKVANTPVTPDLKEGIDPAGPVKVGKTAVKERISVAKVPVKGPPAEDPQVKKRAAAEAAAREEAEAKEWLLQEKARQNRSMARKDRLNGAVSRIQDNIAPGANISVPAGSESYAGYYSVLKAIYERAWQTRRPDSISRNVLIVQATITIARNGTILSSRIIEPSGVPVMERSVERVLRDVRNVPPFPEGAKDSERTVTISFKVEGTSDT